ncbi:LOW QUALITY PROTEIN: putative N-acetyltransferase 16 [Dugong dugon]
MREPHAQPAPRAEPQSSPTCHSDSESGPDGKESGCTPYGRLPLSPLREAVGLTGINFRCVRVMKLKAVCGIVTPEVSNPEKEAVPDVQLSSKTWSQEAAVESRSRSRLEAQAEALEGESGPESNAKSLGAKPKSGPGLEAEAEPLEAKSGPEAKAKPRSRLGPEAGAQPLDFVVAAEREFEEVLVISGIYGGLDHLPSRYHSWFQDPDRTAVLAKRNGGVVQVIDAGETALVEGLRVAPWERGKGVAGLLQRFCSQVVKRQHPGVKVARLTRDDQLGPRELKKYRLITKQGILLVGFNSSAPLALLGTRLAALRASGTFSPLPTEAVSKAGCDVARLLLSPLVQRDVLPGGTIIQDQPYPPSESNLRLLAAKGLAWRVDSRARPRVLTLCLRPFPIPHGGDGTWRYLNIDAFGSYGAQVQSQLLWHLQRQAPRLAGLNVMCQLFLAPQLWPQLADFCLGLELVKGYTKQYLLEADISGLPTPGKMHFRLEGFGRSPANPAPCHFQAPPSPSALRPPSSLLPSPSFLQWLLPLLTSPLFCPPPHFRPPYPRPRLVSLHRTRFADGFSLRNLSEDSARRRADPSLLGFMPSLGVFPKDRAAAAARALSSVLKSELESRLEPHGRS